MDSINELAERHVRESELHLRHIDELMNKARQLPMETPVASQTGALLAQIQQDRDRLAKDLDDLRHLLRGESIDIVKRSEGLKGMLEGVGLQLEKALAAVFDISARRR